MNPHSQAVPHVSNNQTGSEHRSLPSNPAQPSERRLGTIPPTGMIIDLPAEVAGDTFVVRMNGLSVHLTLAPMKVFLALVHARLRTASGLTTAPRNCAERQCLHQTVSRLRAAVDRGLGRGMGKEVVRLARAAGSRYRLPAPVTITADPNLTDLAPPLPRHLVEDILACLRGSPPPP